MNDRDTAVQKLQDVYIKNGYVTNDEVYEICDKLDVSIFDTDYVMNRISSLGILVVDRTIILEDNSKPKDETIDYAQVDYNKIYRYFLSCYPNMKYTINIIKSFLPIQHGEADQLIAQIRSGNKQAKEILFQKYIRVALKSAYNYRKRTTISLEDIFQEACMGILKAIDQYVPYEHTNFTTYCSRWIMQKISRYIADHESFIKVPIHVQEQVEIIKKDISKYSHEEIQEMMTILKIEENIYIYDIYKTLDEVNIISNDDIEEQVFENIRTEEVLAVLEHLPKREKDVLCMRYGLQSHYEYTLEEAGNKMNVTRERIRQIEAKALRRLRNPDLSKNLHDFL